MKIVCTDAGVHEAPATDVDNWRDSRYRAAPAHGVDEGYIAGMPASTAVPSRRRHRLRRDVILIDTADSAAE